MKQVLAPLFNRIEPGRAVIAFGLMVVATMWAAIAWDLGRERERLVRMAGSETANLSRAFADHVLRAIDGLDHVLLFLQAEYLRDPQAFRLSGSGLLPPAAVQLARIGADGMLVDSTVPGFAPVDLSDRNHFRVHLRGDAGLYVSKPVLGRASGRWSVQLTRRLHAADGSFAGVLVASLDPVLLSGLFAAVELGDNAVVLLAGDDGVIRAASDASLLGRVLSEEGARRLFSPEPDSQRLRGPFDQEWRIATPRQVGEMNLAVLVGRSEASVLVPLNEATRAYLLFGGALSLALGAVVMALYRLVRRQADIARDLSFSKSELMASRERLRRYVADLERIAEIAAHDLQEPLRRVVAYAQLLAKHAQGELDAEGRDYVAQVVDGARHMRKLVRDLESFVAVDRLPPVEQVVSADAAMEAARSRLADAVRDAGASLVVQSLPEVAADARSLAEIFSQLLDNAIRYRAVGRRPIVNVTARREGGMAVFSVRDNGMGIAERDRNRIFEIFHRLQKGDGDGGTGIGLAIVRRLVERLGGKVWVESQPGQGSTFSFTLPLSVTRSGREAQAA